MRIIRCPNCKNILLPKPNCLQCEKGHSFDIAKEGYINLILANQKKKNNAGDNISMIKNREAFLSSGNYNFLSEEIETLLSKYKNNISNSKQDKTTLLDLGCGSGYYTRSLINKYSNINKVGIDVSKSGIATAAKKDKQTTYLVASIYNIPLIDNCVDIITNIFAPCDLREVGRVLTDDGLYIKVIPHNNHMREIAELIYDNFKPHTSHIEENINNSPDLSVIKTQEIMRKKELEGADLFNLISMTPYVYKFRKEQLANIQKMVVTFSFKIIIGQIIS